MSFFLIFARLWLAESCSARAWILFRSGGRVRKLRRTGRRKSRTRELTSSTRFCFCSTAYRGFHFSESSDKVASTVRPLGTYWDTRAWMLRRYARRSPFVCVLFAASAGAGCTTFAVSPCVGRDAVGFFSGSTLRSAFPPRDSLRKILSTPLRTGIVIQKGRYMRAFFSRDVRDKPSSSSNGRRMFSTAKHLRSSAFAVSVTFVTSPAAKSRLPLESAVRSGYPCFSRI